MKKQLIGLLCLLFSAFYGFSQSVVALRGDTVKVYKQGGTAELVVQNKTKDTLGFMMNSGNGLLQNYRPKKINAFQYVIGPDTLNVGGSSNGAVKKISISGLTSLTSYGDSYTAGYIAVDATKIFPKQIRDSLGLSTLDNQAANASPIWNMLLKEFAKNYNGATRTDLIMSMTGVLDCFSNQGDKINFRTKVFELTKVFIANAIMTSTASFNSTTKTTYASTNGSGILSRSRFLASPDSLVTASNSAAHCNFTFTGDNLVIGTFASIPGVVIANLNISIDGNAYGPYTLNQTVAGAGTYASLAGEPLGTTLYPISIIIRGLSSGSHTVIVSPTNSSTAYLDYWGVLASTANAKPVLIADIPHMDNNVNLNYSLGTIPNINKYVDAANKAIHQAINQFNGYQVVSVETNNFWNPYQGVQRPDNLHPGQLGENMLTSAFLNYVYEYTGGPNYVLPNEYNPDIYTKAESDLAYIQNQIAGAQTSANFWIGGTGKVGTSFTQVLGNEGFSSTPSIHSSSYYTEISDQNIFIYQAATGSANSLELRMAGPSSSTHEIYSGVIDGFNFDAANETEPFYIVTSGFSTSSNHIAGSIHIRPGTFFGGGDDMTQYTNDSLYLEPAGTGVIYHSGRSVFTSSMQYERRAISDVNSTISATDFQIAYSSLTATRSVTLPTVATVSGMHFIIQDEAGTAGTNNITIVGTVNGSVNPTAINTNFGTYRLYSNGTAYIKE